jgi:hypothetical protein
MFRYSGVCVSNPGGSEISASIRKSRRCRSDSTARREIDYTNIAPGRIQLEVNARNSDGVWNARESVLSLVVEPAYWQTS